MFVLLNKAFVYNSHETAKTIESDSAKEKDFQIIRTVPIADKLVRSGFSCLIKFFFIFIFKQKEKFLKKKSFFKF